MEASSATPHDFGVEGTGAGVVGVVVGIVGVTGGARLPVDEAKTAVVDAACASGTSQTSHAGTFGGFAQAPVQRRKTSPRLCWAWSITRAPTA